MESDKEDVFRYIVGQCMYNSNMPPHQVIHHFVEQWKAKFLK